jgi:hypothetical protein
MAVPDPKKNKTSQEIFAMVHQKVFSAVLVLVLASLACRINIEMPEVELKTGPTTTAEIRVETPDEDQANLTLKFGAGELFVRGGAEGALVDGEATYNVTDLKPEVSSRGQRMTVSTGELHFRGLPNFNENIKNEWDLKLGLTPMHLVIEAGAYQGEYELGGLSLLSLEVTDGAADVKLAFSEPNLVEMDSLRYKTGASNVALTGLANANFRSLVFEGGAGSYQLDFSGEIQREMTVKVSSGVSQVVINIPPGAAARVIFSGGLTSVDLDGGWKRDGKDYVLEGEGPEILIEVNMGAGKLELRSK